MYAKSPQSCPTFCNPMDQVPLSMGFSRQEYWMEWVAGPSSRDLPDPGIELLSLLSPALAGGFITTAPPGKPKYFPQHSKDVTPKFNFSFQ